MNNNLMITQYIKRRSLFYSQGKIIVEQAVPQLFEIFRGYDLQKSSKHLLKSQTDLANQLIKDPYNFDFLTLTDKYKENEFDAYFFGSDEREVQS